MKIAFISSANSWHIQVRTKYLVSKGHTVYFFALYPGGENPIEPKGVKCIEIKSKYSNKIFRNVGRIFQIRMLSKKYKIDVLHIMGMGYGIYALFAKANKIIFENNGSDVLVIPEKNLFIKLLCKIYYKFLYLFADAVVQDSKVAQYAGIKYGAPINNNEIIELGIDFQVFNLNIAKGVARKRLGLGLNQKMVFSPRSFTPNSNNETIIETIPIVNKIFPDVQYVFCRHFGNLEQIYLQLITELNVENNVKFTGFLDNELDMPFYSTDADLVLSVLLSDSSPRSVYEAMACGTPVIISELPWYHGKFERSKDLLTVPIKDPNQLASSIIQVLSGEKVPDLNSAYLKVEENINMLKHSENMEALYYRILSDN